MKNMKKMFENMKRMVNFAKTVSQNIQDNVNINNVTNSIITINGQSVISYNSNNEEEIEVDGVKLTLQDFNQPLTIVINGDVKGDVKSIVSDIRVNGNCNSIKTTSGDIKAHDVSGGIKTTSGDVEANNVTGDIETVSGDVNAKTINGNLKF